jgi:type II secretory pathway component PulM
MRDAALLLIGFVLGGIVIYVLFVQHFAAAIEARVRAVLTQERQRFTSAIKSTGKDVGQVGQGLASKIAEESSKL